VLHAGGPGDPAGERHVFTATTDAVKALVIYAPPYGENPKNVAL
jgi:hypothetical protein